MRARLREQDESASQANSAINFRGQEHYGSGRAATFYALAKVLILLRLVQFLYWMFKHKESLITQAELTFNLEEKGAINLFDELKFELAVKFVNQDQVPLNYDETYFTL